MQHTLYVTTADENDKAHNYRLPVTDTVPEGHEITDVRVAGTFTLAQILTGAQRTKLNGAVRPRRFTRK